SPTRRSSDLVRDVALAVAAEDLAVRIRDRDAVVVAWPVLLEERDRDHDLELPGELAKLAYARMLVRGERRLEPLRVLPRAEVDALEQLAGQHDLRAALGGLPHERFGLLDVG